MPHISAAVGNDSEAYINALRGRDPSGAPVKGWHPYNQEGYNGHGDPDWQKKIRANIGQMVREVPVYEQYCVPGTEEKRR